MELKQSLRFVENNESKRIFTGQRSVDGLTKLYHFTFMVLLTVMTFGIWFILLLLMKKRQFHPDIYIKNTNNPIDIHKASSLVKEAGYELSTSETPFFLINIKSKEFILSTDTHVYYTLANSQKIMDLKSTSGKLPISSARDIKSKKSMSDSLGVMFDGEVIGALDDGCDPRVIGFLQEFSKDVREQI